MRGFEEIRWDLGVFRWGRVGIKKLIGFYEEGLSNLKIDNLPQDSKLKDGGDRVYKT